MPDGVQARDAQTPRDDAQTLCGPQETLDAPATASAPAPLDVRTPFEVVVIAASLGGPAALATVVAGVPDGFPVPVLVVQHRTSAMDASLVGALQRRSSLPVRFACDGEAVAEPGISVLPARHTATVGGGRLWLRPGDGIRTADPLLTSVAATYRRAAIAVVLTGRLDDGAVGVRAVKRHGGRTLVQDPTTARAPSMPAAALATGCVDLVLPLPHIPHALVALAMAPGAADLLRVPPAPWASFAA